ncbi:MAG: Mur ligase family protein [Actinomycetota bacterium]
MAEPVRLVELRVLEGPNLYFTRPAVKVTLAVPGWLGAKDSRAASVAAALALPSGGSPGRAGSEERRRFVVRLASQLTRRVAQASHVRLAVRGRTGSEPDQTVVAFPWRRRGSAEALGREIAALMDALLSSRRSPRRLVDEAAKRVDAAEPGPEPSVADPDIPVISVTGTNGKTTTVRLLAHLVRAAGRSVAFSSTDGVYVDDRLVEAGDYSGFGGAGMALAQDPDVAVLETARGGILLRGIGVLHNDVAVVTNVSADHLDLQGIHTLDQLAEVKATITRITRPGGWDVLNADDPRVLSMRRGSSGRVWLFSLDPDHPAIRAVLAELGRAMTILDGRMTILEGSGARPLVRVEDVPVTIAGVSGHNVQNAMAAAAAALAIGLPQQAVVRGLRTFVLDPERNPGRANLFTLDGRVVVIDYAHNEAGMMGLTELCHGLRRKGREVWLAFCTAGDRRGDIIHAFAYRAARGADHVAVAELSRYLRGRDPQDIVERLRAGAVDGGATEVPVFPDEVHALALMVEQAKRGDVVAVTALGQRPEIFAWLQARGARRLGPGDVRRLVRAVRASRVDGVEAARSD